MAILEIGCQSILLPASKAIKAMEILMGGIGVELNRPSLTIRWRLAKKFHLEISMVSPEDIVMPHDAADAADAADTRRRHVQQTIGLEALKLEGRK
ncbi:hypothetical protein CK623_11555 [Vandammella animalimorsus]|uniref:Uncharacterized protein n=2 Tax=Vandammella animalimorsus TaxID=2029117 RepID=A0A2A2AN40_9BURK|nr:hypothetical protein CK623_11555 [Vandammella animalimorsus]